MGLGLFMLSNLRSSDTGVAGVVIWVSAGEFAGFESQHGPRLMVVLGDQITTEKLKGAVTVRFTNPPEVVGKLPDKIKQQVVKFVVRNRDVLLRHWHGEIDTKEMLDLVGSWT
jgi:hypothetical protein